MNPSSYPELSSSLAAVSDFASLCLNDGGGIQEAVQICFRPVNAAVSGCLFFHDLAMGQCTQNPLTTLNIVKSPYCV